MPAVDIGNGNLVEGDRPTALHSAVIRRDRETIELQRQLYATQKVRREDQGAIENRNNGEILPRIFLRDLGGQNIQTGKDCLLVQKGFFQVVEHAVTVS